MTVKSRTFLPQRPYHFFRLECLLHWPKFCCEAGVHFFSKTVKISYLFYLLFAELFIWWGLGIMV